MLIASSPLMFNHALCPVPARLLRVTDVHLNISFSQVNISILLARWGAPPSSLQFGGVCLFYSFILPEHHEPQVLTVYLRNSAYMRGFPVMCDGHCLVVTSTLSIRFCLRNGGLSALQTFIGGGVWIQIDVESDFNCPL